MVCTACFQSSPADPSAASPPLAEASSSVEVAVSTLLGASDAEVCTPDSRSVSIAGVDAGGTCVVADLCAIVDACGEICLLVTVRSEEEGQ